MEIEIETELFSKTFIQGSESDADFLTRLLEWAGDAEYSDNHVIERSRKILIRLYKKIYPDNKLSENIDDAFIQILD